MLPDTDSFNYRPMDWPALDLELSESTYRYFRYGEGKCTIVQKLVTDEVSWNHPVQNSRSRAAHTVQRPQSWNLCSEAEWDSWLEKVSLEELKQPLELLTQTNLGSVLLRRETSGRSLCLVSYGYSMV